MSRTAKTKAVVTVSPATATPTVAPAPNDSPSAAAFGSSSAMPRCQVNVSVGLRQAPQARSFAGRGKEQRRDGLDTNKTGMAGVKCSVDNTRAVISNHSEVVLIDDR